MSQLRYLLLTGLVIAFAVWFVTGLVRYLAMHYGFMDTPVARSSHVVPTARGGGVSIVLAAQATTAVLWFKDVLSPAFAIALLVGGTAVAMIGLVDDRKGVSRTLRIGVHVSAAVLAVSIIGSMPPQPMGPLLIDPGSIGVMLSALAIVWMLNLFNFMDGIDGIVATEATFVCGAAAALLAIEGSAAGLITLLVVVVFANLGFLIWNWEPAKIFLGDTGSGFLGFFIGIVALEATIESNIPIWTWITLTSLFLADATVTLIRRMLRGARWYAPHRTHAYQWLSRRWGGHARVTMTYLTTNILVVFPVAWLSVRKPGYSALLALSTLVFFCVLAFVLGAGLPEAGRGASVADGEHAKDAQNGGCRNG